MIANMIAQEVQNTLTDELAEAEEKRDTKKIKWSILRGVQEANQLIKDLNYEVDGVLKYRTKKISTISLNADGSSTITITKILQMPEDAIQNIVAIVKELKIPNKFAKYVNPGVIVTENNLVVTIKATVPSSLMADLVKGDPNKNWKKAITATEKFGKTLLKELRN